MYHVPQGMPPTATATVANVVWGLNTGVTFPNRVTNLLTGKQKGTKLVVVDPNYTFIAVSYTHLDVYKRQPQRRRRDRS